MLVPLLMQLRLAPKGPALAQPQGQLQLHQLELRAQPRLHDIPGLLLSWRPCSLLVSEASAASAEAGAQAGLGLSLAPHALAKLNPVVCSHRDSGVADSDPFIHVSCHALLARFLASTPLLLSRPRPNLKGSHVDAHCEQLWQAEVAVMMIPHDRL